MKRKTAGSCPSAPWSRISGPWSARPSGRRTSPTNAADRFTLGVTLGTGGAARVAFLAREAAGAAYTARERRYALEWLTNLMDGMWAGVTDYTNVLGQDQTVVYTNAPAQNPVFYRGKVRLDQTP